MRRLLSLALAGLLLATSALAQQAPGNGPMVPNARGGGGTPGGATTQIQYNNGGAFAGDAGLTYAAGGQLAIANTVANTTPLTISGQSLTGSATNSGISYAGTWNTSGGPTALSVSVTNTASTGGLLMNLLAGAGGATSEFKVDTSGNGTFAAHVTTTQLVFTGNSILQASGTSGFGFFNNSASNSFFLLAQGAAATPIMQIGAADTTSPIAQTVGVQNVAAGNSNTAAVNWTFRGSLSTGSGTSGDIILQTGGTGAGATSQNAAVTALTIKGATQNVIFAAQSVFKGFTVAGLPAGVQGGYAFVTDQAAACVAAGAALTGGGAVVCPVFYNGTAWVGG